MTGGRTQAGESPAASPHAPDLVLIGLRASGKSSLGRSLAARRGAPFIDLDDILATRHGHATPGAALRAMGETAFRAAEAALLAEVLHPSRREPPRPAVIALGGGTPTAPGARALLEEAVAAGRARIVLLTARSDVLADRMARSGILRPALTDLPPQREIEHLAGTRLADYRSLAASELDTSDLDPSAALDALDPLWPPGRRRG